MAPEEVKQILSRNLSAAIARDGLSYWELAKRVDVSDQTISNICRGEHEPRVSVMTELAGALGLDWTEMLSSPEDFDRALNRRGRQARVDEWISRHCSAVA